MSSTTARDRIEEMGEDAGRLLRDLRQLATQVEDRSAALLPFERSLVGLRSELRQIRRRFSAPSWAGRRGRTDMLTAVGSVFRDALEQTLDEVATEEAPTELPDEATARFPCDVFPIADVLRFLSGSLQSGTLAADLAGEKVELFFREGQLIAARSSANPPGQRLGELLVAAGALGRKQLAQFTQARSAGERLGEALVREGALDLDCLRAALHVQAIGIIRRLLAGRPGELRFVRSARESGDFALDLQDLLLEGISPAS